MVDSYHKSVQVFDGEKYSDFKIVKEVKLASEEFHFEYTVYEKKAD